jgi:hypothetical protein
MHLVLNDAAKEHDFIGITTQVAQIYFPKAAQRLPSPYETILDDFALVALLCFFANC